MGDFSKNINCTMYKDQKRVILHYREFCKKSLKFMDFDISLSLYSVF